jgi:NADH-quinone oxidoreductase subunit N
VSLEVVSFLSAEIVLVAAALVIYMGGAFSTSQKAWAPIAFAAILLAAASLWSCGGNEQYAQNVASRLPGGDTGGIALAHVTAQIGAGMRNSPVIADHLATFGRWFALAVGGVLVLMAWRPLSTGATPEYLGSLLLIVAGLMLVSVASSLVLLFVGLELISIPTYIVLSLGRRDPAAQEAAVKYFYLSILASALLLYGLSFVYGATGTMLLPSIGAKLSFGGPLPEGIESFAKLGMVLVLAGLCFRVTAVPFHFYAPDVYQGTIHANAALLSVLPKAAGLLAIVRVIVIGMPDLEIYGWKIVLALSVLTMTVGNVLALWQDNLRRLLAYSSIANAGYMLIGITVGLAGPSVVGTGGLSAWNGVGATFFYLCVYAAATLGAFSVFAYLGRERQQLESIDELAGLGRTRPWMAAALAVCMFSLAGVPPMAGLWGKLLVFGSALNVNNQLWKWFVILAVIGVLNAAVAAYYYLKIVGLMYFREPLTVARGEGGAGAGLAALVCTLAVLVIGFYPAPLMRECLKAGKGKPPELSAADQTADAAPARTVAKSENGKR